jgi:hypothetical protein
LPWPGSELGGPPALPWPGSELGGPDGWLPWPGSELGGPPFDGRCPPDWELPLPGLVAEAQSCATDSPFACASALRYWNDGPWLAPTVLVVPPVPADVVEVEVPATIGDVFAPAELPPAPPDGDVVVVAPVPPKRWLAS